MEEEGNLIYMRLRNGETMIGMVTDETETMLNMTAVMNVDIVERAEYAGIAIMPAIPFGIDQSIEISKTDILFRVEPPEILAKIYVERAEEAVEVLIEYLEKQETIKKNKNRLYH